MNKNTKKVCKNVTLTLSVLLTSCGGGGGGGTPGHAISSDHHNPEIQVDAQNIEHHSIASETDKGEDAKDNHDLPLLNKDVTSSSPTLPTPNANTHLDEQLHNHTDEQPTSEVEVDAPKIEDTSSALEKEKVEETQESMVSPSLLAPSMPKTDAGTHTQPKQESKSEVGSKADNNSVESTKEPKENHESSSSNEESTATPAPSVPEKESVEEAQDAVVSPAPSMPKADEDEKANNHAEQESKSEVGSKADNNSVGSKKEPKESNESSLSNEQSVATPAPSAPEKEKAEETQDAVVSPSSPASSMPKTDVETHTQPKQESKSEVDAPKSENNSKESEKEAKENHESSSSNEQSVAAPAPSVPEKEKVEEVQDNSGSSLPKEDAVTSSPMPSTPNTSVDENINNHSAQEPSTKADSPNVENNSSESEKGIVEGMKDNSDLSSSNEGSTASPSMPLPPKVDEEDSHSEQQLNSKADSTKAENHSVESKKESKEKVENTQDATASPSSPEPLMPKADEKTNTQPKQEPNAEVDSKAENNLMVPEKESVKGAEDNSISQPSNGNSTNSSQQIVSKLDTNASSDHLQSNLEAQLDATKVGSDSLVSEKQGTSEEENTDSSLSNKDSISSMTPLAPNADVDNSEEKSKTEVASSQTENTSIAPKQEKTEDAKNSGVSTLPNVASAPSSPIVSAFDATASDVGGKSETPENKPATPINNTLAEQNPNFKGNFLGIEEEKRADLYHSDESKIYHVGILDTFFYESENFKKENNTSRLVYINQYSKDDEDKRHHGTMVAQVFVKNNKSSDIYAESIVSNKNRSFDTGEGVFHFANLEPSATHYQNLYNRGVRIFSNSYSSAWTENGIEDSYMNLLAEYAERDSIFIWAAGNQKKEQSSLESHYATEHKKPKIRNGWISVAAVEDDIPHSGKKLAEYSNKVGDKVKNWGISAKGNWVIDLPKGECQNSSNNGCTRSIIGTSFSTPTVSATVANVWNKFPWMDNHLVVLTVLSTANKPTDREQTENPDATFGWGILNNDRAIRGPGRFDKRLLTDRDTDDLLTVNLRNMHYTDTNKLTWANPIAGDAGIRKKGNGTLYFTGNNSYEGDTVIEDGAIQISRALTKSKVKIESKGALIAKNYNSMATVGNDEQKSTYELQNDGGTLGVYGNGLEIKGNYKGKNGAKIAIDIDKAKLKVNGTLDIGEKGYIVADVENILSLNSKNSKENVIVDAGKIENYNGEYKVSSEASKYINIEDFTATDKQVKVKYKRNTTTYVFKEIDYTPTVSEVNAGNLLDTRLDDLSEKAEKNPTALSANTSRSVARIMSADSVELPKIVKSLSGEIYASSQNIFVKQNRLFNHTLSSRIASLMNAEKSGVWLDSLHTKYNLHQAGYSQGNVTTTGTQIGIDGKLSNNLTLGAAFVKGKSSAQFGERVGNIESKSSSLSLYGSYDFNQFYLSGRLGGSRMNNNIKRDVIDQRVESSYQSKVYNLYAELGKLLQLGNMSINPFLAGEFSQISRGQFKENAEFGIRSDKTNYNQKHVVAGLRGTVKLDRIHLMANLSHSFALNAQDFNFDASFKDSERKVSIKGVKQPKHSTFAELGIAYEISKHFTLQSKYSLTMQGAKKENNVFHLGAVYNF